MATIHNDIVLKNNVYPIGTSVNLIYQKTFFKLKKEYMMNNLPPKKIIAASILALTLPLASLAVAYGGGHDDGDRHCNKDNIHQGFNKSGPPPDLMALQLSDKQEDEIFALMHNQEPALRDQHKERMKLMGELRATSQADKFDDAKAQKLADRLAILDREITLAHARIDAKIYALLTPEQRAKARQFKWDGPDSHHERDGQQPTGFRPNHSEAELRIM